MRYPTQFNPPNKKYKEGLLAYSMRCNEAKKKFNKERKELFGQTRDEQLQSRIPKFEEQ